LKSLFEWTTQIQNHSCGRKMLPPSWKRSHVVKPLL